MSNKTGNEKTALMIEESYRRDMNKAEIKGFMQAVRESRKFGFPITCTLNDKDDLLMLGQAARLLLRVASTWPIENVPTNFVPSKGAALFVDSQIICASSLGNTKK